MVTVPRTAGSEQRGERPALIIQNDLGNQYSGTTIIAMMTSQDRGYDFHVPATGGQLKLRGRSFVMLEQVRTIAMERLGRSFGKVDEYTMEQVDAAIHRSLGISYCPAAS